MSSTLTVAVYPCLMALVAGVDSSTQSVKIVIRDANSGELIREGRAPHPDGTEVNPEAWWSAFNVAVSTVGGLDDVAAISVGGQQHGMVTIDELGKPVRNALLWNDTRSATAADALNAEIGGGQAMADACGSALVAAFTASKVRWLADHEPENAARVAAIALPHDWLSWQMQGGGNFEKLFTDRSDASGTGYFDSVTSTYRRDLLARAIRSDREIHLPRISDPALFAGETTTGIPIAPGAGDNAAAAFGVQATLGDVVVSLGTSGTAFAVSNTPTRDGSGSVAGFADVTGNFLPLVCTLNAARILDAARNILGVNFETLSQLALAAPAGANGLTMLPYFEGERTPNRPDAHGVLNGMNLKNSNPQCIARAMIEGMLGGLVDAVDSLSALGVSVHRIILVGGAAKNQAVGEIASALFGREILIPPAGEYVANGAARQAAWALLGEQPQWDLGEVSTVVSTPTPHVMDLYRELKDATVAW